jgi:hypothetical protein
MMQMRVVDLVQLDPVQLDLVQLEVTDDVCSALSVHKLPRANAF